MKNREWTKAIHIEWRKPANARERKAFGVTYADNRIAKVFIDSSATMNEQVDTFFHEMAHVFFAFTTNNVPLKCQEKLADQLGKVCAEVMIQ